MRLPSGGYIQVRKVGTHAVYRHTLHLVDFWLSEADFRASKPPVTRQDVILQWNGPHTNPLERFRRVLDAYMMTATQHGFRDGLDTSVPWSDSPDPYGNLAQQSMAALTSDLGELPSGLTSASSVEPSLRVEDGRAASSIVPGVAPL